MADLTIAAIVLRLEGAVTGLSGWQKAPMPVGLVARSARPVLHKGASVMALETEIQSSGSSGRRATTSEGAWVHTRIRVEWGFALQVDDFSASLRNGYAAEAALLAALCAVSRVDLTLVPERLTRSVPDLDRTHLIGTIDIICAHSLALA